MFKFDGIPSDAKLTMEDLGSVLSLSKDPDIARKGRFYSSGYPAILTEFVAKEIKAGCSGQDLFSLFTLVYIDAVGTVAQISNAPPSMIPTISSWAGQNVEKLLEANLKRTLSGGA